MRDLLKSAAIQLLAAVAVYLILFLLGETLAFLGWLVILGAIVLFLVCKEKWPSPWWWQKAKRKLWDTLSHFGE